MEQPGPDSSAFAVGRFACATAAAVGSAACPAAMDLSSVWSIAEASTVFGTERSASEPSSASLRAGDGGSVGAFRVLRRCTSSIATGIKILTSWNHDNRVPVNPDQSGRSMFSDNRSYQARIQRIGISMIRSGILRIVFRNPGRLIPISGTRSGRLSRGRSWPKNAQTITPIPSKPSPSSRSAIAT